MAGGVGGRAPARPPPPALSGVAEAARIAREVLESGAPGLHLYTYNKPEPALALLEQIGLVEPAESVDSSASVKPSES